MGLRDEKKAEHWNEYHEVLHVTAFTPHVLCKHCKAVMSHPNRNGDKSTSTMRRHLDKCGTYARYRRQLAGESGPDTSDSLYACHGWTNTHARPVMTADRLAEKLLRIVVSANQPFIFIENQEFRDLLDEAFPKCPVPSRQIMPDLLSANANRAVSELRQELADNDSKVSLALDVWTTRTNYAFLGTFHALYELVTGIG